MSTPFEPDPRLAFYLEHKAQIDEWIDLPKLEVAAADLFFRELADLLEAQAPSLPGEPSAWPAIEGGWPLIMIHRSPWCSAGDRPPLVSVVLEWPAKPRYDTSYHGIKVDRKRDEGGLLMQAVRTELQEEGACAGWKQSAWFAAYQYIKPSDPRFWEDRFGFRDEVLAAVITLWGTCWPLIDRAVMRWRKAQP